MTSLEPDSVHSQHASEAPERVYGAKLLLLNPSMACSRHPSSRQWIFPEGPGRLGTVMLAVVCPWREGGGWGVVKAVTHIYC